MTPVTASTLPGWWRVGPARLAGPGYPGKITLALDQAGWRPEDRDRVSPCGRGRLTVPDRPDGTWHFTERGLSEGTVRWAARFSAGTPAEFVATFAVRLADALADDGLWRPGIGLPVPSYGGVAVLERADWTRERSLTGTAMVSPDGTGRYESRTPCDAGLGRPASSEGPERVFGAVVDQHSLWWAWFTANVPAHLLDLSLMLLASAGRELRHGSQLDPAVLG